MRPSSPLLLPGVQDRNFGLDEVLRVPGYHHQTVNHRRGGDQRVGLRVGVALLLPCADEPPLAHEYCLIHFEDARAEPSSNAVAQPPLQLRAEARVCDTLDAEGDLGDGNPAQETGGRWRASGPCNQSRVAARPLAKFGNNVDVEQPASWAFCGGFRT